MLVCYGYVKVKESLHSIVIIWVNNIQSILILQPQKDHLVCNVAYMCNIQHFILVFIFMWGKGREGALNVLAYVSRII